MIWRYKSISFSRIFSNPNVWNATLLVFRISFSPYFFPVLFQTTTFEMQRFSSTWRYKTFHFPVLFQAATFEIQRLKYQLVISLVHDVIKHFIFNTFSNHNVWMQQFSSTWRYKTFHFPVLFSRTFSNRNVWNATLLVF